MRARTDDDEEELPLADSRDAFWSPPWQVWKPALRHRVGCSRGAIRSPFGASPAVKLDGILGRSLGSFRLSLAHSHTTEATATMAGSGQGVDNARIRERGHMASAYPDLSLKNSWVEVGQVPCEATPLRKVCLVEDVLMIALTEPTRFKEVQTRAKRTFANKDRIQCKRTASAVQRPDVRGSCAPTPVANIVRYT